LATLASVSSDFKYPRKEINDLWGKILLNQFHDVLPGSSIEMVYKDADKLYDDVYRGANKLIDSSLGALGLRTYDGRIKDSRLLSTLPWPVQEADGRAVKGFGVLDIIGSLSTDARVERQSICLENDKFKVIVQKTGCINSLYDKENDRELVPNGEGMGQFIILDDDKAPVWQAWDTELYSLESRRVLNIDTMNLLGNEVTLESRISKFSTLKAVIKLRSNYVEFDCVVDWHEPQMKFLKVEFPVNLQSIRASYESQFGITERPTHFNTSWDQAKFEVSCQKWADLSENNYGVAILNDCKYGFAIHGNVMRLSLLRSSKEPNPTSDMKQHRFRFAIMPHIGQPSSILVRTAREFNSEFRLIKGFTHALSAIELDGDDSVILDTVKRGEDDKEFGTYKSNGAEKTVVLRLYEAVGGLGRANVKTKFPVKSAYKANILEDKIRDLPVVDNQVLVTLRAFEVLTLVLVLE
jgi:alpha-mannosidase